MNSLITSRPKSSGAVRQLATWEPGGGNGGRRGAGGQQTGKEMQVIEGLAARGDDTG